MIFYQLLRRAQWLHSYPIRKARIQILEAVCIIDIIIMAFGAVYAISYVWHLAGR
jgi:hypothetical protein